MTTAAESLATPLVQQAPMVDSVEREQLRMLFEHMAVGMVLATVFALLLAAHLHGIVPTGQLAIWLVLKLGIVLPRVVLALRYRRGPVADPPRWMLISNALLAVDGFVWGLGGLWFTQVPMAQAAVVASSLCCVACVATFGLQVSFKATLAYVAPMVSFTAAGMLMSGNEGGLISFAGLVLVLLLMLSTARRAERRLLEGVRLRLLAQQIADERAQALVVLRGHNEQKSRFIATVSHEVRSPLHGIISLAELMDRDISDPAMRSKMALITSTGQHLLTIVSDLLDLSKIEAGSLRIDPKAFDLSEQLARLSAMYLTRAQQAGVALDTRFALPSPLWVVGDSSRVRQVIDNLVGNAIKFTPSGGTVTLQAALLPDRGVEIVVTDTGPGISQADQLRLFRPFEQGSASPDKAREGAGLGLAIAHDLVALMQGSLGCESEVGRGASFRCLLPLPLATVPVADTGLAGATAPAAAPKAPGAEAVRPFDATALALVVDDDPVSALVATAALQRAGWGVEVVTDGQTAVDRLTALETEGRPRLVVMDCDLPRLDGLEATRRVRACEKRAGLSAVRIVALTGRATAEDRADCLKAGMDEVFSKPFSMAALTEAAARYAGDRGDVRSTASRPTGAAMLAAGSSDAKAPSESAFKP